MITYDFDEFISRSFNELDSQFSDVCSIIKPSIKGPFIAGGAVRQLLQGKPQESDIDIFFVSETQKKRLLTKLKAEKATVLAENKFNIMLSWKGTTGIFKIQLIHFEYYETLSDVLDSFDFTICQFGYNGKDLIVGDYSIWDLSRKRLALHKLTYGVATTRRLLKYTKQGFYACSGVLQDILQSVAVDPNLINSDVKYID